MKKINSILCLGLSCAVTLFSCATLQKDIVITTIPTEEIAEISNFEYRLTFLDAEDITGISFQSDLLEQAKACEKLAKDIDSTLKTKDLVLAAQARLIAIKGRAFLIEDKMDKARECYSASCEKYKGDIHQLILAHRLGLTDFLNTKTLQESDKSLVKLENAIDAYKAKDYLTAVASFDEAFISTDSYYEDAFKKIRDFSWNNREISDDTENAAILSNKSITIGQMMILAQSNRSVMYQYLMGEQYAESALFKRLVNQGLITSVTEIKPPAKTYSYTKLTRIMEARFLWNVYCAVKNKPALKTRYSDTYKKANLNSPIADVSTDSPDFDAVVGCIEYELMDLPDGKNFNPNSFVSGIDFYKSFSKIKK